LFNGTTNVGSLSYNGVPDPTFTGGFAGIQSTIPFNIVQITFNSAVAPAVALDNIRTLSTAQAPFIVYSGAGPDAPSIAPVVDAFRNVLGNNNGNTFLQQPGGRREINWDGGGAAAPATTFPSPMTTFNSGALTRGGVFTTPGAGFEISGQPNPEFGDLNPSYPGIFAPFSAPRLFTRL